MSSCRHFGCRCQCYKESSSKWSRNKCNSCNHSNTEHGITQTSNNNNIIRPRSITSPVLSQNTNFNNNIITHTYHIGDTLQVLYEDEWCNARILNTNEQRIEITYDEWDEYSNEWINKNSKRLGNTITTTQKPKQTNKNITSIWQNALTKKENTYASTNTTNINRSGRSSSVSALAQQFMKGSNKKYTKTMQIMNASFSNGDCSLCAASNVSNIITLTQCKHKLCKDCMNHYIKISCTDKLNIKCPFCGIPLDRYQDVKPALSHQEFYNIYLSPNLKKCLSADCHNTVKLIGSSAARLDCAECNRSWCVHCKVPWHNNMDCDGYKQTEQYITAEQQFKEYLNENKESIKKCPECSIDIEKNEGCNHMHCVECDVHFCWKCGFSADNGNSIYTHMSSGCC